MDFLPLLVKATEIRESLISGDALEYTEVSSALHAMRSDELSSMKTLDQFWKVLRKTIGNLFIHGSLYEGATKSDIASCVEFGIGMPIRKIGYPSYIKWCDVCFKSFGIQDAIEFCFLKEIAIDTDKWTDLPEPKQLLADVVSTCIRSLGDTQLSALRNEFRKGLALSLSEISEIDQSRLSDIDINKTDVTRLQVLHCFSPCLLAPDNKVQNALYKQSQKNGSEFHPYKDIDDSSLRDLLLNTSRDMRVCLLETSSDIDTNEKTIQQICSLYETAKNVVLKTSSGSNQILSLAWLYNLKCAFTQYALQEYGLAEHLERVISCHEITKAINESNADVKSQSLLHGFLLYSSRLYQFSPFMANLNAFYYGRCANSSFFSYTTGYSGAAASMLDYLITASSNEQSKYNYVSTSRLATYIHKNSSESEVLILLFCSYKYLELVDAWIEPHREANTVRQVVIIALDQLAFNALRAQYHDIGLICLWDIFTGQVNSFDVIFRHRMYLLARLISLGASVFMSGLDSLWFDPVSILEECKANSVITFGSVSPFNGDFIFIRGDSFGKYFANHCLCFAKQGLIDQDCIGSTLSLVTGSSYVKLVESSSSRSDSVCVTFEGHTYMINIMKRRIATRLIRYISSETLMAQPAIRGMSSASKRNVLKSLYALRNCGVKFSDPSFLMFKDLTGFL